MNGPYRVAVLTVSDRCSRGEGEDRSGPALVEMIRAGLSVDSVDKALVPDEVERIRDELRMWAGGGIDLILTTGGTGLSPRDVTPEAAEALFDKHVPGFMEEVRRHGLTYTPDAILSRGVCGVIGRSLVLTLPGSVKGATQSLEALIPILAHALDTISGEGDAHH